MSAGGQKGEGREGVAAPEASLGCQVVRGIPTTAPDMKSKGTGPTLRVPGEPRSGS